MKRTAIILIVTAALATMTSTSRAANPSFNCVNAYEPDEFLICQSGELSKLDQTMAALYSEQIQPLTKAEKRELRGRGVDWFSPRQMRARQRAWLNQRHACDYDFDCIKAAYDQRIAELKECGL